MLTITNVWARLFAAATLLFYVSACSDENAGPVPEAPGTFLLDHTWQYRTTTLLTTRDESVPFPAPDVLDGSFARFGADGRVLVKPSGFDEFLDLGARYLVTDSSVVRLKLDRGVWFPFEYQFAAASGVLLLNPEPRASDAVTGFVRDVISAILAREETDGPAAAFTDGLYRDARVAQSVEDFLWTSVHGSDEAPAPTADATAGTLYASLAPSGVFEPGLAEDAVLDELSLTVEHLEPLERGKLTNRLVSDLLDSEALDATLMAEAAERLIRYALYQQVLAAPTNLAAVERIELELAVAE